MIEPCENCGTPVKPLELHTGRVVLVHLTEEASEFNHWLDGWQEHELRQCRAIRELLALNE